MALAAQLVLTRARAFAFFPGCSSSWLKTYRRNGTGSLGRRIGTGSGEIFYFFARMLFLMAQEI